MTASYSRRESENLVVGPAPIKGKEEFREWLRGFPSTYGDHSLDADGHCHTKDSNGYVGHHRKED